MIKDFFFFFIDHDYILIFSSLNGNREMNSTRELRNKIEN